METLRALGEEEVPVEGILEKFNTKLKKKILLDSAVKFKINMLKYDGDEKFLSLFNKLIKIIYKDANFISVNG